MIINPVNNKRDRADSDNEKFFPLRKRQRTVENTASFAPSHLSNNRPPIKIHFPSPRVPRTPIKIHFTPNTPSFSHIPLPGKQALNELQNLCNQLAEVQEQAMDIDGLQDICFQIEQGRYLK